MKWKIKKIQTAHQLTFTYEASWFKYPDSGWLDVVQRQQFRGNFSFKNREWRVKETNILIMLSIKLFV